MKKNTPWAIRTLVPDAVYTDREEFIKENEKKTLEIPRVWLFADNGVTKKARDLQEENDFLWSTRKELDSLLEHMSLRKLPEI